MEGTPKSSSDNLPTIHQLTQLSLSLRDNADAQNLTDIISALGRKIKNDDNLTRDEKRKIYYDEVMKVLKEAIPNDKILSKQEGAEQPTGSRKKSKSKKSKKSKRSKRSKKSKRSKRSKKY